MTTKQDLKNDLATALALNQQLRSTALAAALFPLIDAFELVGRGHGIRSVAALPTAPSDAVPDILLLSQADGDRPAGLYYRVAAAGDWINAYRMVVKEGVATLDAGDYFNLLAYETRENDEGLFVSNGVRWIRLTRNRIPGWQGDWTADTRYLAGDMVRLNTDIHLCIVATDGDALFPNDKFINLSAGPAGEENPLARWVLNNYRASAQAPAAAATLQYAAPNIIIDPASAQDGALIAARARPGAIARIEKVGDPSTFVQGRVSGAVTVALDVYTFPISDPTSAGMIAGGDQIKISFESRLAGTDRLADVALSGNYEDLIGAIAQRVLLRQPASAASVEKIITEDDQAYTTTEIVVHQATPNQAEYENIRFDLGYFSDESALDPTFYVVGRYYYNFAEYTPRVVAYVSGNSGPKRWVDANAADLVANITGDVGHFASDAEATPHIQAVGNVYYNERLRVYRRATSFTPGAGPERGYDRLRLANADDLARIDNEFSAIAVNSLAFVIESSPAHIDVNDFPPNVEVSVIVETSKWVANGLRVILLGNNTVYPFDPAQKVTRISIPVTQQMQNNARLVTQGDTPSYKTRLHVGIQQDNVELASTAIDLVVRDGTIGVVEGLTADLRRVSPPSWVTATGTGVGIAISRSLVSDLSTLSFAPTATVPSAASAGDEVYYYVSVPTADLNLDDWRINIGGVGTQSIADFGPPAGTVGGNSVYLSAYAVGAPSSGYAPGDTITLQFHDQHHTAYSGELEGRALMQVQDIAGGGTGTPGTPTEQRVVEAEQASAATEGKVAISGGGRGLFTTVEVNHPASTPSWDNTEYQNPNFIGVLESSPPFGDHTIGQWFASPFTLLPRILVQRSGYRDWDTTTWAAVGINTFRGGAVNSAGMADRIQANGDLWIDTDDHQLFVVSNFVAGNPGSDTFDQVHYATVEDVHRLEAEIAEKHGSLNLAEQIGLVKFQPEIPTFQWAVLTDINRTWRVLVDGPELVTGDLWYQRRAGAGEVGSRVKWTSTTNTIDFPFTDTSTLAGIVNFGRFPQELWFYDAATGGNLIEIIRVPVGLSRLGAPIALTSEANILFDVDRSAAGIVSGATLTLAHDATLRLMGGRDGSETTISITQGTKAQGGWTLALHSSIQLFGGLTAPVLSEPNGAVDLLRFRRIGAVWYYIGRDEQQPGGAGTPFTPSKSNLYNAVKEIFHPATNAGVTADDANNELDVSGGGPSATPASAAMVGDDRFVFVDVNDGNALKRTQATLTQMIDRFRSGMAEATASAKGLLSAALFNKLTALPTRAELTTEINNIGDLRTRYSTGATPVAGDRFFFTDENQSGDPIRFTQFRELQAVILAGLVEGANDLLEDSQTSPIAPVATNRNRILWRWWEHQLYYNKPVHYSAPALQKRALASTDLPMGYTWGGVHTVNPGGVNNNIWFDRQPEARGWRRHITSPITTNVFWTPNFGYLGYFDTEALAAAAANDYEDAHGEDSSHGLVYVVMDSASVITGLTARAPDDFEWVPIDADIIIGAANLDAATAEKKKAFRQATGAAAVSVGNTLPAAAATNDGDWVIISRDVSSGLAWQDFAGNALTSAQAGDLGVYVGGRTWQRVGNLILGPAKLRTQVLASAAAIAWNVASGHTATLSLGVNATLNMSGGADGDMAFLKVKQDTTGGRTLALHANILRFKDVVAPVLSTTANSVDLLMFVNDAGTWNYVGIR